MTMEDRASGETSNIPCTCPYEAHEFVKPRRQWLRRCGGILTPSDPLQRHILMLGYFPRLTGTPSLERLLQILEQNDESGTR